MLLRTSTEYFLALIKAFEQAAAPRVSRIMDWCAYGLPRAMTGLIGASPSRW